MLKLRLLEEAIEAQYGLLIKIVIIIVDNIKYIYIQLLFASYILL